MALAIARETKLAANECGIRTLSAHAVYTSTEAHMSVSKAVALLGIGRDNLRAISVDDSCRMIPAELEKAGHRAVGGRSDGRHRKHRRD
jgi:aromatic-L-amino-acid/L-tryptophan decarboxylase